MRGTVPQKVGRIIGDLIIHPQYLSRCIKHNVVNGRTPLDLELPWFSYAAIDFLDAFVKPGMKVFEYGSGGSTLFFARRAKTVLSVEDNQKWFELVSARLQKQGLSNAAMKLCPFDFKRVEGFEQSDYLRSIPEEPFDIIVIDGSEEWTHVRPVCFERAENRISQGGIIVVDDSWRYPELREQNRAKSVQVFQSLGPCRPGVTSTDVFFY